MIRCKPKSICSWNFYVEGEGHYASLEFKWLGEQGAITADGKSFKVRKQGVLSSQWTLDHRGHETASARHSSAFTRTFEIQSSSGSMLLRAQSPFSRGFRVERSGELLTTISPNHAWTRRATIETFAQKLDFPIISFAFWLVVLTWFRESKSANSPGAFGPSYASRSRG